MNKITKANLKGNNLMNKIYLLKSKDGLGYSAYINTDKLKEHKVLPNSEYKKALIIVRAYMAINYKYLGIKHEVDLI